MPHTRTRTRTRTHAYTYTHAHAHTRTHAHTHTRTHAHTHTRTHARNRCAGLACVCENFQVRSVEAERRNHHEMLCLSGNMQVLLLTAGTWPLAAPELFPVRHHSFTPIPHLVMCSPTHPPYHPPYHVHLPHRRKLRIFDHVFLFPQTKNSPRVFYMNLSPDARCAAEADRGVHRTV